MRKWKRDCHLQKTRILKEEAGITLVELLAVLALMSVVILLGGAVHMFGQKQFRAQTESASKNNDLSYAMTVMSSDLRKSIPEIESNPDSIKIMLQDGSTYTFHNDRIVKDGTTLIAGLSNNAVTHIDDEKIELEILLTSSSPGVNNKTYRTTIYFRGEPTNDEDN